MSAGPEDDPRDDDDPHFTCKAEIDACDRALAKMRALLVELREDLHDGDQQAPVGEVREETIENAIKKIDAFFAE